MKNLYVFLLFFLSCLSGLMAQTSIEVPSGNPPHPSSTRTRFPLSVVNGFERAAILFSPQELGFRTGAITKVSFFMDTTIGFFNAQIPYSIYFLPWNDTTFTTGVPTTSILGSALPHATGTVDTATISQGNWVDLTLPTPFVYSGGNLIVFIETNLGGAGITNFTSPTQYRTHFTNVTKMLSWNADNNPPTTNGTLNTIRPNVKFEFGNLNGADLGLMSLTSPSRPIITGTPQTVTVQLGNNGNTTITSGSLSYQLDNSAVVTESLNNSFISGQVGTFSFLSQVTFPSTGSGVLKVWVNSVNGAPDILAGNDTLVFNYCAPLNGAYTIGANGNFQTFAAAIDALKCGGVSGSVTFNVAAGTYTEGPVVIPPISGASATSPINFAGPASGTAVITFDTVLTKMGFDLVGADYFVFSNLTFARPATFTGTGATQQFSMRLRLDADFNTITNCTFLADTVTGTTSTFNRLLQINSSSNNLVTGCTFRNGNNQLDLLGLPFAFGLSNGNKIASNKFVRVNNASFITVSNQKDLELNNNEFNTILTSTTAFAGTFSKIVNSKIHGNFVTGDLGAGGFSFSDFDGDVNTPNLFYNNVVSGNVRSTTPRLMTVAASFSSTAIPVNPTDYMEIANNTLNISLINGNSTTVYGLINATGGTSTNPAYNGLVIKNNILYISGSSATPSLGAGVRALNISLDTTASVTQSNNNVFFLNNAVNSNLVRVAATDFASLADWTTARGQDANSQLVNPGYLSPVFPIPTTASINNIAQSLSYVTDDILGAIRNATTPDPGAYEFNVTPVDLGVVDLAAPISGCGLGNDTVKVKITNRGTVAVSNFNVTYQINGGAVQNTLISATINPGDTAIYSLTPLANFTTPGSYSVRIQVSASGDGQVFNDTLLAVVNSIQTVATFPYTQNFEAGNGGWLAGGVLSSWALGTPNKPVINTAAPNGTQSYVTGLTGTHNPNERSFVMSPCFNFSTLPNPRIRMNIFWSSQLNIDGAVLQGSIDGGTTWFPLGSVNEFRSINWYNNNGMSGGSAPGSVNQFLTNGGTFAWSGLGSTSSGAWVTAERSLPELANQSNARLRVAFASDGTTQNDGFAFDNIEIWQPLNPVITSVNDLRDTCSLMPRTVEANITALAPIQTVNVLYNLAGNATGPFSVAPMTFNSATSRWIGTIPAGTSATMVYYKVAAISNNGLTDTSLTFNYTDDKILVSAGPDVNLNAGQTTTLRATYNEPKIKFTEITLFSTGTGRTPTYPAHFTTTDADFVEISNLGSSQFDMGGYIYEQVGISPRTFAIPAGTIVPGGGQLVLHLGTGTDSPANLYFNTGGTNGALSSGSLAGFILRRPDQTIVDVVATNNFNIVGVSGVTSLDWSGTIPSSSGRAGVIRKISDNNNASDWVLASATELQTVGAANTGLTFSGGGAWSVSWNTTPVTNSDTVIVGPFATAGTYPFIVTVTDGNCSKSDTINVIVTGAAQTTDAGFTRISAPLSAVNAGSNQVIRGWLRNFGTASLSNIAVGYNVNNGTAVTQSVPGPLNPGDSIQVTFTTPWLVPAGSSHVLKLFSRVTGDVQVANDTATRVVIVSATDAAIQRIVSPATNAIISGPTPITATIRNVGSIAISNFDVAYSVNNVPRATQTVTSTIQPGDSLNFTFTSQWTPTSGGSFNVRVYITGFAADGNRNNDTANVIVNSVVSVKDFSSQALRVYPNPSADVFNVDISEVSGVTDLYLIDPMGRVVKHEAIKQSSPFIHTLNVSDMNEGLYFIQVITSEGRRISPVVIKK